VDTSNEVPQADAPVELDDVAPALEFVTLAHSFDVEVNRLWPADGEPFEVEILMDALDDKDPFPELVSLQIESDEPMAEGESVNITQVYGRGNLVLSFPGTRLDESQGGDGRCYTLRLIGKDRAGNYSVKERILAIPLQQPLSLFEEEAPDFCGEPEETADIPVEDYVVAQTPWGTTRSCSLKSDGYCSAEGARCQTVNVFKCKQNPPGVCKNRRWWQLGAKCQCR
jgi:hypothetical protein